MLCFICWGLPAWSATHLFSEGVTSRVLTADTAAGVWKVHSQVLHVPSEQDTRGHERRWAAHRTRSHNRMGPSLSSLRVRSPAHRRFADPPFPSLCDGGSQDDHVPGDLLTFNRKTWMTKTRMTHGRPSLDPLQGPFWNGLSWPAHRELFNLPP
uniref:Secreted protein n=1 Tax=Molossus molossus TaxID=27622 RepID=A0A7J8EE22_MOLMO|nr:hypothetical protein HJG59_008801 [Molossus molossus]